MSCEECEEAQEKRLPCGYYRIDCANIEICGCPKHAKMAINKMRQTDGLEPIDAALVVKRN